MKRMTFLLPVILLLGSCMQMEDDSNSPLEGFWESRYSERHTGGEILVRHGGVEYKQTKAYGKEDFIYFVWMPDSADLVFHGGGGKYEMRGDTLIERSETWGQDLDEYPIMFRIEIRGDSLFQSGPINPEPPPGWGDLQIFEIFVKK